MSSFPFTLTAIAELLDELQLGGTPVSPVGQVVAASTVVVKVSES